MGFMLNVDTIFQFVSLSFPLCWIVVNYLALAWVFGVYGSARHMSMTDDPFDDNVERSEQMATNQERLKQFVVVNSQQNP